MKKKFYAQEKNIEIKKETNEEKERLADKSEKTSDYEKVNLNFQNMDIVHTSPRALVAVVNNASLDSSIQVNVNNVDIDVHYTKDGYYLMYGLFNLRNNSTILMTDVNATVACTGSTDSANGIIRVGNPNESVKVYARLQNCTLDTSDAENVSIELE